MRELRTVTLQTPEVRAVADDTVAPAGDDTVTPEGTDKLQFTGHAAVFNQRTWIGPKKWGFWEVVDPGFFRNVLKDDAAFLVNHDPNIVLARNPGTMTLSTDDRGLLTTADWDPADDEATLWAGRVRRGDVTQMSFAFTVAEEKWATDEATGEETRTLLTAEQLYDVSLVTYPAYPGTDADCGERDEAAEVVLRHRGYDPRTEEPRRRTAPDPAGQLAVVRHRFIAAKHRLPL